MLACLIISRMPEYCAIDYFIWRVKTLQWRHNEHDCVSNHQPYDCLLNRLFRRRWNKTSKLCVTGLCARNLPVIGEFPAQRSTNAENVSMTPSWTIQAWQSPSQVCDCVARLRYVKHDTIGERKNYNNVIPGLVVFVYIHDKDTNFVIFRSWTESPWWY